VNGGTDNNNSSSNKQPSFRFHAHDRVTKELAPLNNWMTGPSFGDEGVDEVMVHTALGLHFRRFSCLTWGG
jgi:hypothetical protein